jgi:lipopolysaccharide export LptBFGC system permease protein LptF
MTRPGTRLRSIARRFCNRETMERLIDPAIADLQCEHADARRAGARWRAGGVLIAGYLAVLKVVAIGAGRASIRDRSTADGDAIGRTVRFAAIATTSFTALFVSVPLRQALATLHLGTDSLIRLTVYLVPQALAVAVPMGMVFGVLSGGAPTRRSRRTSVLLMFGASLTTLLLVGWLMPEGNQAYRETMFALINGVEPHGRLALGTNELTLGGLRQLTRDQFVLPLIASRRSFDFHSRLALAFAPLALGQFALGISSGRRRAAGVLTVGMLGLAGCFAYYLLMYYANAAMYRAPFAVSEHVPPIIAAWLPNLAFWVSALLLHLRTRRRSAADPSRHDGGPRSEDRPAVPQA